MAARGKGRGGRAWRDRLVTQALSCASRGCFGGQRRLPPLQLLPLGRGEQRSGGRVNAGRLADALEAVVAAVLLSCGLERTQEVVERLLAPLFDQGVVARAPGDASWAIRGV